MIYYTIPSLFIVIILWFVMHLLTCGNGRLCSRCCYTAKKTNRPHAETTMPMLYMHVIQTRMFKYNMKPTCYVCYIIIFTISLSTYLYGLEKKVHLAMVNGKTLCSWIVLAKCYLWRWLNAIYPGPRNKKGKFECLTQNIHLHID